MAQQLRTVTPEQPLPKKLRELVREMCCLQQKSRSTEKTYWQWIRAYIFFHGIRHPKEMGPNEVRAFLTYLAAERNVTFSTQSQALNALVWLYRFVIKQPLPFIEGIERARKPSRLPVV